MSSEPGLYLNLDFFTLISGYYIRSVNIVKTSVMCLPPCERDTMNKSKSLSY